MAVVFHRIPLPSLLLPPPPPATRPSSFPIPLSPTKSRFKAFSSSSSPPPSPSPMENPPKFIDFPFVSAPHKKLMLDLVSTIETHLESQLSSDPLPPDVQFYHNESSSALGTLHIRSGLESSQVDFIMGSWIHCKLPTGGALNITSISAYLKPSTDAPNFLMELIQSSPTSLVLILDLPPRKDLVFHPEYLKTFYEDTQLDSLRQTLFKLPEVKPYFSPELFIRSVISPTAVIVKIDAGEGGAGRMEEIVEDQIGGAAKEAVRIWLEQCACGKRCVEEEERVVLEKRDGLIKKRTVEIDLGSSFPRMFGPDVANRVVGALRGIYGV